MDTDALDARAKRARAVLAVVTALFAMGLAVAGWLHHYAPLQPGSYQGVFADPPASLTTDFSGDETWRLEYNDGEHVRYTLSIRNTGRLAVTIVDLIRDEPWFHTPLRVDAVLVTPADTPTATERAEPLRPFILGPGRERTLLIDSHFDSCEFFSSGTGSTLMQQRVKYRTFGMTNTQWVALTTPIKIPFPGPDTPSCPRSKPESPSVS